MSSSAEELKNTVLEKLRTDPLSITTEDARRLSEQVEATDRRSAKIVSAVESLAVVSDDIKELDPKLGPTPFHHNPGHAQSALVNDLNAAVDHNPHFVTADTLKMAQSIVTKMHRALGQNNAPHPELEAELQAEIAKIEPKIEQGTVTKAEADYLHSLEARAHGHTEKGGVTAHAQSVAAKRDALVAEVEKVGAKVDSTHGTVNKAEADHLHSLETRALGRTEKGGPAAHAQSAAAKRERKRSGTISDNTNESTPKPTGMSSSENPADKLATLSIKEKHVESH